MKLGSFNGYIIPINFAVAVFRKTFQVRLCVKKLLSVHFSRCRLFHGSPSSSSKTQSSSSRSDTNSSIACLPQKLPCFTTHQTQLVAWSSQSMNSFSSCKTASTLKTCSRHGTAISSSSRPSTNISSSTLTAWQTEFTTPLNQPQVGPTKTSPSPITAGVSQEMVQIKFPFFSIE